MIHDVKQFFGLEKEFRNADFMETDHYHQVYNDMVSTIKDGNIVALSGIVGCGKTVTVRRIRQDLKKRNEILVSSSMSVEKQRVKLSTLIFALFSDLMADKKKNIPSRNEDRERKLVELIRSKNKPVVLFVDEAHDLHHITLKNLKQLQEVGQEANALLSIVLIGHPKLMVNLNRPSLEEIGSRVLHIPMNGIQGVESRYINWILERCLKKKTKPTDVFTREALDLMAKKFTTPLQINHYAWKAFVKAFQIGQKPVDVDTLEKVIANNLNSIKADLKRHGFDTKDLSKMLALKPTEIRSFFKGKLSAGRTQEIESEMFKLGLVGAQ